MRKFKTDLIVDTDDENYLLNCHNTEEELFENNNLSSKTTCECLIGILERFILIAQKKSHLF